MARNFNWGSVGVRWVFAMLIVFATYNPHGFSYFHWALLNFGTFGPEKIIAGVLLVIGWIIFIRSTLRSLGGIGLLLVAVLFGAILWLLIDWNWIAIENQTVITYSVMVIMACILTVGMSWSHIRHRLTGQVDIDDIDEND